MANTDRKRRLPPEILATIISSIVPDTKTLAYPACHIVTKTLYSLLTVSRNTHEIAAQALYAHCLYIDSPWRLTALVKTIYSPSSEHDRDSWRPTSCQGFLLRSISGMFLAPFPDSTINERDVVGKIELLFRAIAPDLSKLAIDMPLRSHYPEDDRHTQVRPILHHAFECLTSLEEFTSIRDELFLDYWNPALVWQAHEENLNEDFENDTDTIGDAEGTFNELVFARWPRLKRLALYNVLLCHPGFVEVLQSLSSLSTIVLTRPDGAEEGLVQLAVGLSIETNIVVVNACYGFPHDGSPGIYGEVEASFAKEDAGRKKPGCASRVFKIETPLETDQDLMRHSDGHGHNDIKLVQQWTADKALDGTLWTWPRTPFLPSAGEVFGQSISL